MKKLILAIIIGLFTISSINAQSVFGKWKTIDDETGKARSIIEIYEQNGKAYGKIVDILDKNKKDALCEKCPGDRKNKPTMGMVILNDLKKDGDEWNGGKILDPTKGKEYKCYITLENKNKLKVRGFVGFALIGRTQYWHRVE